MDERSDNRRNRRRFLRELGTGAAVVTTTWPITVVRGTGRQRPNVIVIMTDDQGYGDLGVTGNPVIRTPHIDAMAERSARMEQFYVHPVCSPTRACLMTGRYNYRTRVIDTWIGRSMMDPEEVTIAELLRGSGYSTGIFGKWHLGDNYPMRPMDRGFEESLVHRGGGIGQPSDPSGGEGKYTDPVLFHNGEELQTAGFCTDVYFDAALEWVGGEVAGGRSFFAYIAPNAPHGPFHDVPQELYEEYRSIELGNHVFPQEQGHSLPEDADTDRRARIFSMITNIDDNVGKLFRRLDDLGVTGNTIVMFMVDNGPNGSRYVAGMRGSKSSVYEGGIRSPFFVHWPDRLAAGHSSDRIAAHIDVLPTILEACEVPIPGDLQLDGLSILPLLQGDESDWPERTIHIQSHRGDRPFKFHHFMARKQKWKLVHASGFGRERFDGVPALELYDMEFDPLEEHNISHLRPDVVQTMFRDYEAWFDDVGSTRPDNYAPPKIVIGTSHENPTVLTRQNWRSTQGSWARYTNGRWELLVANLALWDIRLRFPVTEEDVEVVLHLDERQLSGSIPGGPEGASGCVFNQVVLPMGPLHLSADIITGGVTEGPSQVDLIRL